MDSSKSGRIAAASVLGFALALTQVPEALAQDAGWYVGVGVGRSEVDIDTGSLNAALITVGATSASTTADETSSGWKLFLGYQFNRNFAVEGGAGDYGRFSASSTTTPAGSLQTQLKGTYWNLDAVGTLPLQNNFSLLGRIGLVRSETKLSLAGSGAVVVLQSGLKDSDTNFKVGVGLGYEFSKNVGIRGEWERLRVADGFGGNGDLDLVSVSLRFRF